MTTLRQRMLEDLQLRNYSPQTIDAYLRGVAHFAQHFRTSPARLGPEHIRQYQLYLIHEKRVSWSLVIQTVAALRFFYRITLRQPWMIDSYRPTQAAHDAAHHSESGRSGGLAPGATPAENPCHPDDPLCRRPPRLRTLSAPGHGY